MRYSLAFAIAITCSAPATAQTRYLGLGAELGVTQPLGSWSDRYALVNVGAVSVEWARGERWTYALRGELLFGNGVEEDPLAALRAPAGPIYGEDGFGDAGFSAVTLKARGYRIGALVGYELPFGAAGWRLRAAVGPHFLVHKIRIQDDPGLATPQVGGARRAGYDRRAGGPGGTLELGPRYVGQADRFVVYGSVAAGYTASSALRDRQFDLTDQDYQPGADGSLSVRVGIILGLYRGGGSGPAADDIYY